MVDQRGAVVGLFQHIPLCIVDRDVGGRVERDYQCREVAIRASYRLRC